MSTVIQTEEVRSKSPPDLLGQTKADGCRRGHRLMLNEQRFDEIRKNIWLNHSIPHLIARKLEGVSDPGGWAAL
jgi:hypothetical protein